MRGKRTLSGSQSQGPGRAGLGAGKGVRWTEVVWTEERLHVPKEAQAILMATHSPLGLLFK